MPQELLQPQLTPINKAEEEDTPALDHVKVTKIMRLYISSCMKGAPIERLVDTGCSTTNLPEA